MMEVLKRIELREREEWSMRTEKFMKGNSTKIKPTDMGSFTVLQESFIRDIGSRISTMARA